MALNEDIVASVANTNLKVLGDGPASMQNMALQNALSFQQSMNTVTLALVGRIGERIATLDPTEALGVVGAGQQVMKGAGNTPPVTP